MLASRGTQSGLPLSVRLMNGLRNTCLSFGAMLLVCSGLFHSWLFAAGFLFVLAVHELGHYVAGRLLGIDISLPLFTPVGALMNMRQWPANAFDEALMAFSGPFCGTGACVVVMLLAAVLQVPELTQAGQVGLWLNLFNLIPLAPLDGGRISIAIDRRMWVLGLISLGVAFFYSRLDWFSAGVVVLVTFLACRDYEQRCLQMMTDPGYYALPALYRVSMAVAYFSLLVFLLFAARLI